MSHFLILPSKAQFTQDTYPAPPKNNFEVWPEHFCSWLNNIDQGGVGKGSPWCQTCRVGLLCVTKLCRILNTFCPILWWKKPIFCDSTTGFPTKWYLTKERGNSILMMRHFPRSQYCFWLSEKLLQPIRSTYNLDLGSNTSSIWNFCTVLFLRYHFMAKPFRWHHRILALFWGYWWLTYNLVCVCTCHLLLEMKLRNK